MIIQKDVTLTRNTVICDFCGDVMIHGEECCEGCQKHVCKKCRVVLRDDPMSGGHLGDWGISLCKACDEKMRPFAEKAEKIRHEAAEKIARLEDAWKWECRGDNGGVVRNCDVVVNDERH